MWQHFVQSDPGVQQQDVLVEIEAGEPDERRLIREAQEREGSLIARLAQVWRVGVASVQRRPARIVLSKTTQNSSRENAILVI